MAKGKGQNNNMALTNQQLNSIKGLLGISNDWLEKIYNAIISNSNGSSQPNNQQQNTQNQQQPNNQQQNGNQNQQQNSGKTNKEKEEEKLEREKRGSTIKLWKNIGNAIIGAAKSGANKWMEIEDRVKKVGRSIGMSHEQVRGYQQNIMKNYGSMAAQLGMTIDELTQFQEKYTKATGRAVQISQQQVKTLASASKLVGEVATNKIVENMDNFGASTKTATSYLALNMARAKANGLDAQKASEAFADNVKLASKYTFSEGINGISKMTLLSQKLKFNMESVANAAEKFETIEGAISTAANLQMLGGTFAQQFSNPLEAMNMAMLDMEGFTDKVINSVKGKATFDRETGQIDMSAMDKRFIKEASKQLGISYDEMYNMAVQPTKIREIERELRTDQNFDETEKAFLANKAEYDPESKSFKITYFDEQGNEQQADISKISKDQLKQIRQQHDVDKAIYGDVHSIHGMLQDYLQSEGYKSTSMKEHLKGIGEASGTSVANFVDKPMSWLSGITKNFTDLDNVGGIAAISSIFGGIGYSLIKDSINKKIGNWVKTGSFNPQQNNNPPQPPSGNWRQRAWGATKGVGKFLIGKDSGGYGKLFGKIGAGATGVISSINAASNIIEQNRVYEEKIKSIERSSLSTEEKAKEKAIATKERNVNRGESIGSAVGATAGAVIGAMGGPIGMAIGGAVGEWASSALGKLVGGSDWFNDSEENVEENNSNAQPLASVTNDTTTNIINGEREKEYLAVTHISNGVDSVNGYLSQMVSGDGRTLPVSNGKTNNKNVINGDTYLSSNETYGNTNGFINNVNPINNNLSLTNGTYASNNIISIPTIGTPTYVNPKKDNNYYLTNNTNTPTNNNINLNVNGSLKLIGDNSVGNIDINTLLKDSNFINELKSILLQSLNQSNGISSPKGAYANMVKTADNNFNYGTLKSL